MIKFLYFIRPHGHDIRLRDRLPISHMHAKVRTAAMYTITVIDVYSYIYIYIFFFLILYLFRQKISNNACFHSVPG